MRVHLSLGSNVGRRAEILRAAVQALDRLPGARVTRCSDAYETVPVGPPGQRAYLNMAVEIETALEPLELLDAVKAVEMRLGRRQGLRWGPRRIDIDIVLWGARRVATDRLTIPHKAFRRRAFVLTPLAEIAGGVVDPVTGRTVAELARGENLAGRVLKKVEFALEPLRLEPNRDRDGCKDVTVQERNDETSDGGFAAEEEIGGREDRHADGV